MRTNTCPFRALRDTQQHEWSRWFELTHEVDGIGMSGVVYRLRRLPAPGAIGQQDAKTMEALEVYRSTANQLLRTDPGVDDLQAFRNSMTKGAH